MKTFSQVIKNTSFDDVWSVLEAQFTNVVPYKNSLMRTYGILKGTEPSPQGTSMKLAIRLNEAYLWDDDEEPYYQAVGMVPGDEDIYAIGANTPDKVAAMEIDEETAEKYSDTDITAFCIVEITYFLSAANSAWGMGLDTFGGGILASQNCAESDPGSVSLDEYRRSLGIAGEAPKSGIDRFFK